MVAEDMGGASRPASVVALVCALSFQGLSGLAGGVGLIADPTGATLGIPRDWLTGSPFGDYLVPGLILLILLGVGPLAVVRGLWTAAPWSWSASLGIGVALVVWIGVQISIIGYQPAPPLQAVYGALGLGIIALSLVPSVRTHLGRSHAVGR